MADISPARVSGYTLCLCGAWLGMPGGLIHLPGIALLLPAGMALIVLYAPTTCRAVSDTFLAGTFAWWLPLLWVRTPALFYGGDNVDIAWLWPLVIAVGKGMYLAILAGLIRLAARRAGPVLLGAYAGIGWFLMEGFKASWCKCPLPQFVAGLSEWPWLVQGCSLTGAYGLAGILAACCVWLTIPGGRFAPKAVALTILAGLGVHTAVSLSTMPPRIGEVRLALVQGNTPLVFKWSPAITYPLLERYASMTRQALVEHRADLVIWPETALPTYFLDGIPSTGMIRKLTRELAVPLLLGVVAPEPDGDGVAQYNSAVLLGPDGTTKSRTEKTLLVPFGEYIPKYFTFIPRMVPGTGLTRPGRMRTVLEAGKVRIGVLICFESMFPPVSSELTGEGANILVNLSNDAWFAGSAGPDAHLAHARLRAVEQGRYLARCTNTGVTCLIDPRGRMVMRADVDQAQYLDTGPVALVEDSTIYQRTGRMVWRISIWLFAALTVWFLLDLPTRLGRYGRKAVP